MVVTYSRPLLLDEFKTTNDGEPEQNGACLMASALTIKLKNAFDFQVSNKQ